MKGQSHSGSFIPPRASNFNRKILFSSGNLPHPAGTGCSGNQSTTGKSGNRGKGVSSSPPLPRGRRSGPGASPQSDSPPRLRIPFPPGPASYQPSCPSCRSFSVRKRKGEGQLPSPPLPLTYALSLAVGASRVSRDIVPLLGTFFTSPPPSGCIPSAPGGPWFFPWA